MNITRSTRYYPPKGTLSLFFREVVDNLRLLIGCPRYYEEVFLNTNLNINGEALPILELRKLKTIDDSE